VDDPNLLTGVSFDVTEQKEAEQAQFRSLVRSIEEGFCILQVLGDERSFDCVVVEANPAFGILTGVGDATGGRLREIAPDLDPNWLQNIERVARTGEPTRFQNAEKVLGGYFDVNAFRIGAPEERKVAVLLNDITERTEAEEALRESHRRKDEFLAMLGHELRNPLGAMRTATALLEHAEPGGPKARRALSVLQRQSSHMSRLLDDLLDLSRIARGKIVLRKETIDLRRVIQDVMDVRDAHAADRQLEVGIALPPEPIWICGDEARLAQIVDNLLGNAIKFTAPGGSIDVTLEREDGAAVIRVRDTGVGIPHEELPEIFEPFRQGTQDVARATGGLGLGLSLVRGLVELHDGTVEARSAGPGEGSTFEVRLPLADPEERAAAEEVSDVAPHRILLVEDNVDAGTMLRDVLELSGHQVEVVTNGEDALDFLHAHDVELVLCDIGLPGMSGHDVARAIRSDPDLRDIKLIALTGYGHSSAREQTAQSGFDDHLVKPIDIGALEELLDEA
jgi:signal transduction histidine kinase